MLLTKQNNKRKQSISLSYVSLPLSADTNAWLGNVPTVSSFFFSSLIVFACTFSSVKHCPCVIRRYMDIYHNHRSSLFLSYFFPFYRHPPSHVCHAHTHTHTHSQKRAPYFFFPSMERYARGLIKPHLNANAKRTNKTNIISIINWNKKINKSIGKESYDQEPTMRHGIHVWAASRVRCEDLPTPFFFSFFPTLMVSTLHRQRAALSSNYV